MITDWLVKIFGIPTWDGKSDNPPVEGKLFVYKGKLYKWEKCPCKNPACKRPMVYTAITHQKSVSMTYRIRGTNTGDPSMNIIAKVLGTQRVADELERQPLFAKDRLFAELDALVSRHGDKVAFLQSKGVTGEDMQEAYLSELLGL